MSPAENSWIWCLAFISAAAVAGILWFQNQRASLLALTGVLVLLAVGCWIWDVSVVTNREQVKSNILDLVKNFQTRNLDGALEHVSPSSPEVAGLITAGHHMAHLGDDVRVTDFQIQVRNEETRIIAKFRVNGTVGTTPVSEAAGAPAYREWYPTRWESRWQKEGDHWRMYDIEELDRMTGKPTHRVRDMLHRRIGPG